MAAGCKFYQLRTIFGRTLLEKKRFKNYIKDRQEILRQKMLIHKMILSDENMHPIAVQIPYKEWLQIEMALSKAKTKNSKLAQFYGTIKLSEDPLIYQEKIRKEWE